MYSTNPAVGLGLLFGAVGALLWFLMSVCVYRDRVLREDAAAAESARQGQELTVLQRRIAELEAKQG